MPVEKVPSWIERLLLPKLSEISGNIKALDAKIDSTNERIDSLRNETKIEIGSLRNETKTEITSVRKEIEGLRIEMNVKFDSLEKRIPVIEEITALKLRIAELEKKLAEA